MHKSNKGFTLAEVLVTLAIIGVVAALTIPTLIQSTNNSKYSTSLKKNLSILAEALQTKTTQDGLAVTSLAASNDAAGDDILANYFAGSLNVIKHDAADGLIYLSDGSKMQFRMSEDTSACTDAHDNDLEAGDGGPAIPAGPDGICDAYAADDTTDVNDGPPDLRNLPLGAACANIPAGTALVDGSNCYVVIDVNGDKLPNKVSVGSTQVNDIYILGITPNSVIPVDATGVTVPNTFATGETGAVSPTTSSISAVTN